MADELKPKKKWIRNNSSPPEQQARPADNLNKSHSPKEARKAMYGKD